MKKSHKIIIGASILVIIYLAAPFPLISYIAANPAWEDQYRDGVPSKTFRALYIWWLPSKGKWIASNPYNLFFLSHMKQVCNENPKFCSETPPEQP